MIEFGVYVKLMQRSENIYGKIRIAVKQFDVNFNINIEWLQKSVFKKAFFTFILISLIEFKY